MNVALEISAMIDSAKAVDGLGDIGRAAADMGRDVARAAVSAADRLDGMADSSDGVASKASQATGGLGALAGGLEAVGATDAAAALNATAIATDFMSGVGDIANLMLSTQAGRWVATKAAQIGYSVATKATTAAQWALNAAMSANPIALVIIAIVALVAAFVIAYKRSETFRNIVQAAMRGVMKVVRFVISAVVGYFNAWRSVVSTVVSVVLGRIGAFLRLVRGLPGKIKGAFSNAGSLLVGVGRNVVQGLIDGIRNMAGAAVDAAKRVVSDAIAGAKHLLGINSPSRVFRGFGEQTVAGLVIGLQARGSAATAAAASLARGVVDGFGSPQLAIAGPDLPALSRRTAGTGRPAAPSTSSSSTVVFNTTVTGAVDKTGTARQLDKLLGRRARRIGLKG